MSHISILSSWLTATGVLSWGALAWAQSTPGYPERVLQWTVSPGETCEQIASALYGAPTHAALVQRYNDVDCSSKSLPEGMTLIVPERPGNPPTATLRSFQPMVRARPPGGGWAPASQGMPLHKQYSVNTLAEATADIRFIDRTRVYLAEHTLVVIYDTAAQSGVSKAPAPRVRLDEGEVQAGLAALRGKPILVEVRGGSVQARSKEAGVRTKGNRTTVSVFDGSAKVNSGGAQVDVPAQFGSAFEASQPPSAPRPLPPAPVWGDATTAGLTLATAETLVTAHWSEVPKTATYRVEVSRNDDFTDLVVREHVPPTVRSFRAEKLPIGTYFVRVRAIDTEDFMGLAATPQTVHLAHVNQRFAPGLLVTPDTLSVHPYGELSFDAGPMGAWALDDGPLRTKPSALDLRDGVPRRVVFKAGNLQRELRVSALPIVAHLSATLTQVGGAEIRVRFEGLEGVDIAGRVGPRLVVRSDGNQTIPLTQTATPGEFVANIRTPSRDGDFQLDVVDSRGRLISSHRAAVKRSSSSPAQKASRPVPGSPMGPLGMSVISSVQWLAPSPTPLVSMGLRAGQVDDTEQAQIHLRAVGKHQRFAFDAILPSNGFNDASEIDSSAWVGVRHHTWGAEALTLGPTFRIGLPLHSGAPVSRIEPGMALGWADGNVSWLVNAAVRVPLGEDTDIHVPRTQGFVLVGGTYAWRPWLHTHALIDSHLLDETEGFKGRAGLDLGLYVGESVFGGIDARVSPWRDSDGPWTGQVTMGLRQF